MYLNLDQKPSKAIAALDSNGLSICYGELCSFFQEIKPFTPARNVVFCLCENTVGALAGYLSFIENKLVPLLLPSHIDKAFLQSLEKIYEPAFFWVPAWAKDMIQGKILFQKYQYVLISTGRKYYSLYDDLALLLTTSGSTGSPKLVRHSYQNLSANAKNVAKFFCITPEDRPIADLPMHYTMGHSVICSHLYAGATVLITPLNLMRPEFWDFFKEQHASTFTGVPYSYEVLRKLRFTHSIWPHLRILTQGGGKLPEDTYQEFAVYAEQHGIQFIPTYGQTECTARMAYLPAEFALTKKGAIGKAIPEGELYLVDEKGQELTEIEQEGEMGYRGPNVTLGYAQCKEDLRLGDLWKGEHLTGDIAKRDKDGIYFIVGRKSRFLKLFGYRVSLDQCERLIQQEFDLPCACVGNDVQLFCYVESSILQKNIPQFLAEKTGIFHSAFRVRNIEKLPRNESGKIIYHLLSNE